jgi:hypothetical protein
MEVVALVSASSSSSSSSSWSFGKEGRKFNASTNIPFQAWISFGLGPKSKCNLLHFMAIDICQAQKCHHWTGILRFFIISS